MRTHLTTTLLLLLATAVIFQPARAQTRDGGSLRVDLSLTAGVPQGELDRNLEGEAIGVSGFTGGRLPGLPIVLGTEIGIMNYGADSRLSLHDTVFDDGIDDEFAIPVSAVRTSVSSNIVTGHFVVRIEPIEGAFRPYVDVLAGVKYFATRLGVESDVVIFRRGISQDAYVTDFAFSYGVGGGIDVKLYEHAPYWGGERADVSLYAGVRYLFGTQASYASHSAVYASGDELFVDEASSRTDLIVPQFGIRVRR